jgi:hypothetical protein
VPAPDRLWVAGATRVPAGEGVFWLAAVRGEEVGSTHHFAPKKSRTSGTNSWWYWKTPPWPELG